MGDLNDLIREAGELMTKIEEEQKAFAGGNKAAGTRVRKAALELKNKCGEIRAAVSAVKNG